MNSSANPCISRNKKLTIESQKKKKFKEKEMEDIEQNTGFIK